MRAKGYKCYNVKCGSCVCKTMCREPEDIALGCACRIVNVQTNAERIRSMSNEELAKFLYDFFWGRKKHVRLFNLEKWLQQPAEEGAND